MRHGARIFVVEDEALIAMELQDRLKQLGYDVCGHASTGRAAIRKIRDARPDLVLLDINLADDLDGFDVAREIQGFELEGVDTAVVFLTAYGDVELIDRAVESRLDGYIMKPFQTPALMAVIELVLSRREAVQDLAEAKKSLEATVESLDRQAIELRLAEEKFHRIVEHITDGLLVEDLQGNPTFANQRFLEMFRISREELDALRVESCLDAAGRQKLESFHAGSDAHPPTLRFEVEARRPDGSEFWAEVSAIAVRDSDGSVIARQTAFRDVSLRKTMNAAMDFMSSGLVGLSSHEVFARSTEEIRRLLSVDLAFVSRLSNETPRSLRTLALATRDGMQESLEFLVERTPCEVTLSIGDVRFQDGIEESFPDFELLRFGSAESYAALALADSHGTILGALGVLHGRAFPDAELVESLLRQFAVRLSSEFEHQINEARFRDLFELLPDGILLLDEHGHIRRANAQAERMFGYDPGQLESVSIDLLLPTGLPEENVQQPAAIWHTPAPSTLDTETQDLRARRRDETTFPVEIVLSPIDLREEHLVVAAIRDVGERARAAAEHRALETRLRSAEKMQALGQLAGGIAHDFNNLLGAIVAHADLVRLDLEPSSEAAKSLGEVFDASRQASELVQQILSFSHQKKPHHDTIDLREIIRDSVRHLRVIAPGNASLNLDLAPDPVLVRGDATQLKQVVMNLGTNALQALDAKGGRVDVRARTIELDSPSESGLSAGRYASFEVEDEGIGMDAETARRVFEPFFTTRRTGRGTGLGLSVVHTIVGQHEGRTEVESTPSKGSIFRILLPLAPVDS